MKHILLIAGLFLVFLFFRTPGEERAESGAAPEKCEKAATLEKDAPKDTPSHAEITGAGLNNSNCRAPRRNVQNVNPPAGHGKTAQHIVRILQYFRLKRKEALRKASECVTERESLYLASLLSGRGYHIYALRKIII